MGLAGEGSGLGAGVGSDEASGAAAIKEKSPSSSISLVPFSLACIYAHLQTGMVQRIGRAARLVLEFAGEGLRQDMKVH